MNAFYKLACALVAWSALSLSSGAETMHPLSTLPASAYTMSVEHPGRFGFVRPEMDLSRYRRVQLEPLSFLTQSDSGDWLMLRALPDNALDRHFRQAMEQALHAHGLTLADEAAPDVMRLQLALALDARKQPVETVLNLATLGDGMAHYLQRVRAVGQVVDSQSNLVLAGSAELQTAARHDPANREEMLSMLNNFSLASADRIALMLGHG